MAGLILWGQRSTVLLRNLGPSRQCYNKIVGQSAGPKQLLQRTRQWRVVKVNNDGQGAGLCQSLASLDPTRPVLGWVLIARTSTKKARNENERCEYCQNLQLLCFYLSPYFGDSRNPDLTLLRIFENMTVFRQRDPKIQAMIRISPCYGLVLKNGIQEMSFKSVFDPNICTLN